jgi:hypothetical protein
MAVEKHNGVDISSRAGETIKEYLNISAEERVDLYKFK